MAELDHPAYERSVLFARGNPVEERPGDLDRVDREAPQIAERGIAGAEVVNRQQHTQGLQFAELGVGGVGVRHQDALGHLDHDRRRVEPRLGQCAPDLMDDLRGDKLLG